MNRADNGQNSDRPHYRRPALRIGLLVATLGAVLFAGLPTSMAAPVATPTPAERPQNVVAHVKEHPSGQSVSHDAARPRYRALFVFAKNKRNPSNSRLTLYRVDTRTGRKHRLGKWRAGSGNGSTNACVPNQGWLPNGWYDSTAHYTSFNGGKIFGIVWQLQNKRCKRGGPTRTELFIHSEMTPSRGQACSRANYRENQCWDGPSDYLSAGCIKLKPAAIKQALRLARPIGPKPGARRFHHLLYVTGG